MQNIYYGERRIIPRARLLLINIIITEVGKLFKTNIIVGLGYPNFPLTVQAPGRVVYPTLNKKQLFQELHEALIK